MAVGHGSQQWRGAVVVAVGSVLSLSVGLLLPAHHALAAVGDITEFSIPTANSGPVEMTAGPDGNLWFTEGAANKVAKVTPAGVVTEYTVPTASSSPNGIAVGSDGNIWFTEFAANKVAKVTTTGAFTEYPVPTAGSGPNSIVAFAAYGNLWFTEFNGDKIGNVTTSGVFTEYPVPTASSNPLGIAASGGMLWVTERAANKVAEFNPSDDLFLNEYTVPTASSGPNRIAAGPDGNVWFTEGDANKVTKMTPSGAFTEYPVPTAASQPRGIAAGPDGNLWVTENAGNNITKVTPAGVFTEYPIPTAASSPSPGVAAGPDGNVWFAENAGNNVAKIDPGTAAGDVTEYPVSGATGPTAIVSGPDGNLWFTYYSGVAYMTTAGVVDEFPSNCPGCASRPGITVGPDGNLWFTEFDGCPCTWAASDLSKVTPAGVITEYPLPQDPAASSSRPSGVVTGPDGNIWFTEHNTNVVGKATTSGVVTTYTPITAGSGPTGIAVGPDGNLWITETTANKVAKVTPSGVFTEYPVPTGSSSPTGIAAGPDGNLWVTEAAANKVAKVTTAGTFTEYTVPTASSAPSAIAVGSDGNMWFTEAAANKIGEVTSSGAFAEYFVPTANSGLAGIAPGPDGDMWFTESNTGKVGKVNAAPTCTAGGTPVSTKASSTRQYTLENSDGATWQEIDAANLRSYCNPTSSQSILLTANADLWTANAGFNQDLGIFVSHNGGADQLLAWKESGGFAGTFSPNAAYVQTLYGMTNGDSYVFKLKWKTNKPASGTTIFAAAGSGPYSPTSLVVEAFPTGQAPNFAVSTTQYTLPNSDGATWADIDATNLKTTLSPSANSIAVLGANVDLFTANAGYNQDIGIFVRDNGGPYTLLAWKESGGFAGTFSPNAAFVKANYQMTGSHVYDFKLEWKTNKPAPGTTIYAAAGSGPYSPTSLVANTVSLKGSYSSVSNLQDLLHNSDGSTWQPMDSTTDVTVAPLADTNSILGANADLFTANAGYNQDIGIFVSVDAGADTLVAWKESGGFAGTFSPNAAFVQATYQMTSGHTYVFKIKWKTNKPANGTTIYAGAGTGPYSPTRLTVEPTS